VTRQELETASEHLESAARASADADVSERLSRVAQKLTVWLAADSGPDHGQLARIENRLHSLRDDVDRPTGDYRSFQPGRLFTPRPPRPRRPGGPRRALPVANVVTFG